MLGELEERGLKRRAAIAFSSEEADIAEGNTDGEQDGPVASEQDGPEANNKDGEQDGPVNRNVESHKEDREQDGPEAVNTQGRPDGYVFGMPTSWKATETDELWALLNLGGESSVAPQIGGA
jgi:hypothetical protein